MYLSICESDERFFKAAWENECCKEKIVGGERFLMFHFDQIIFGTTSCSVLIDRPRTSSFSQDLFDNHFKVSQHRLRPNWENHEVQVPVTLYL